MLPLIHAPNAVLFQKAKRIEKIDKTISKLIKDIRETLEAAKDPEGVGLAAPQVGRSLQLFIIKATPKSPVSVYINPEVVLPKKPLKQKKGDQEKTKKLEGCLSLPSIWGEVLRYPTTKITYLDEKGITHHKTFHGFLATIIQHEYDHLQGILFPKRVLEQKGTLYKSHKNDKGEDVFEELKI